MTGHIRIEGKDLYGPDVDPVTLRRDVGMVFQKSNPFPKSIKINGDLERIGDLAVNIAEAARRYLAAGQVAEQQLLPGMCEIAEAMLDDALQAFVTSNLATAQAVLERDDSLDSFQDQVNRRLVDLMRRKPHTLNSALELMLISRHLERIGDHRRTSPRMSSLSSPARILDITWPAGSPMPRVVPARQAKALSTQT